MPYQFLEDIATADVAFKAWGKTREEMFAAAAEATMNVMVEDLSTISPQEKRTLSVEAENLEMLLFQFLQELIYYKDAERLLLCVSQVTFKKHDTHWHLIAEARGEVLDPLKHPLNVDVKAVTMHLFRVHRIPQGWEATVVLDI